MRFLKEYGINLLTTWAVIGIIVAMVGPLTMSVIALAQGRFAAGGIWFVFFIFVFVLVYTTGDIRNRKR